MQELRRAGIQFLQELNGTIIRFRCGPTALFSSVCDSALLVLVVTQILIIKFNPLIPLHRSETHRNVVGSMSERPIRKGFGSMYIPSIFGLPSSLLKRTKKKDLCIPHIPFSR